jgi:tripartite-type tricarboxylate transporter receptor subunit TctC
MAFHRDGGPATRSTQGCTKAFFAIGLQPKARRAGAPVAEAQRQRVAHAQIAAAQPHEDRVGEGPDVEAIEPDVEPGAVARLDRGVVGRRGAIELRLAHVRRRAPRHLEHAGIVDAECAGRVGERKLGMCARDKRPCGAERYCTHVLRKIGRERHLPPMFGMRVVQRAKHISLRMRVWRSMALIFAFAMPMGAQAQEWPVRPIRFIVPFPAGGSTDVGARLIADALTRALGQQIVIENKSGASGNVGFEAAARSAPDGYTVLIAPDQIASAPHVFKVGFNSLKDFTPVIQLSRQPVVLAVHPSLGVASVAELVALAKKQPGLSYATSGVGTQQHIVAEWFAKLAGIRLDHVSYRGGGQAINDLIAGHIRIGSLGSSPLMPHYKAGILRLIARSTRARSPGLPEVPTYQEAGIAGLVLDQWLGALVPAGTPEPIAARLNSEMNRALMQPAVREGFLSSAQEPVGGSADAFAQLLREDYAKYAHLVQDLNIKLN